MTFNLGTSSGTGVNSASVPTPDHVLWGWRACSASSPIWRWSRSSDRSWKRQPRSPQPPKTKKGKPPRLRSRRSRRFSNHQRPSTNRTWRGQCFSPRRWIRPRLPRKSYCSTESWRSDTEIHVTWKRSLYAAQRNRPSSGGALGQERSSSMLRAWRPQAIHGGLEVARLAGLAENRPVPLDWVRPLLEDAAQSRHEAEIMLWQPGYSPPESTQASLDLASALYERVRAIQEPVENAWNLVDESMLLLPSFSALLKKSPEMESTWRTAVQETRNLYRLLGADPKVTRDSSAAGPEVKAVESSSSSLKEHLRELRTFAADLRMQLERHSKEPEADGSVCVGIDALLETPFPARKSVLYSGRQDVILHVDCSRKALQLPGNRKRLTPLLRKGRRRGRPTRRARSRNARRTARVSIDLLQLGGLEAREPEIALEGASAPDAVLSVPSTWPASCTRPGPKSCLATLKPNSRTTRSHWRGPAIANRSPPGPVRQAGRSPTNPTRRFNDRRLAQLWAWLADEYAYESRDLARRPCSPRPPRAVVIWQPHRQSAHPIRRRARANQTWRRPGVGKVGAQLPRRLPVVRETSHRALRRLTLAQGVVASSAGPATWRITCRCVTG